MAGIYIHIPFCKQACYYCDFHFSTNEKLKPAMVKALIEEIYLQKDYLKGESIGTIYFGGGTPSLLNQEELESIIEAIYTTFFIEADVEVTLEANPDDLSLNKLQGLSKTRINRLSIGVQSFDEKVLKFLNRAHSGKEATICLQHAKSVGFDNISLDLIYGIPGRNEHQWLADLTTAVSLSPKHISAYSLTIEPETVFGRWQNSNRFPGIDEEAAAIQFEIMINFLKQHDFEQYEISNFSRPGFYSKHNSSYWKQEKYLGIGPSAHSYTGETRQYNVKKNGLYIKKINANIIPMTMEQLSTADMINEYMLTTLRTKWGADLKFIHEQYGSNILLEKGQYVKQLVDMGYATVNNNYLVLTNAGKLLADKISSDLFVDP
ncbi:MAG: radical SAM family heme chaperone HemW [Bacteroidota bacterium]